MNSSSPKKALLDIPGFSRDGSGKPLIGLDPASVYAYGHLIRLCESLILDLYSRGLLSGTTHTCIGQELCQMSVVRALQHPDDVVLSNHRNHGHFLTYSGHFLGLVAEIMGRQAGVCGGYGGSQHIAYGGFHSNGVQGGMTGLATGLALARMRAGSPGVVAVIVGDGTTGEGLLYESMNLASVWKVPVLFVVENNGIAQTTPTKLTIGGSIAARGAAFGLKTYEADDSDPAFLSNVAQMVSEVREARAPAMLVINTRRLGPHSKGDDLRDKAEREEIERRDPLRAVGALLSDSERQAVEARNAVFVRGLEELALASPEATFESAPLHAFRDVEPVSSVKSVTKGGNVRSAINAALKSLLAADERVIVLGEDLHEPYGGAFKVTAGLTAAFGDRVISTPISEAGITGAAIGLALAGRRPIVEIMFADFLTLCMDQVYNHAVKFPGMFPDSPVPLVIRTPCGGRRGYGPTHSQSPEHIFTSVPGLTVVYGSHRHDVGQLLVNAATRWPNPTLFLEHKLLYSEEQNAVDYQALPAHAGDLGSELFPTLRRGSAEPDITLVTYGGILPIVEKAVARLTGVEELNVEVVVLGMLAPLPRNSLRSVLADRPHIMVVEESHTEFGVGAEILAMLGESGYRGKLDRIGTAPVPIAAARSLEIRQIPTENDIVARVLERI